MLALLVIAAASTLRQCTITVTSTSTLSDIDGVLSNGCDHIEIKNIVTDTRSGPMPVAFCDLRKLPATDEDNRGYITFTGCDASHSSDFISSGDNPQNVDIIIEQTKLSTGFTGQLAVNKVSIVDCVIDITAISNLMGHLVAKDILFSHCVFTGKIVKDFTAIFDIGFYGLQNVDRFKIEFIECEFNLESDWKSKVENGALVDDPSKQFITVDLEGDIEVSINFERCYSRNSQLSSMKLVKVAGTVDDATNRLSVTGEDNGISVEWSRVDVKNQLLLESSEWTTKIQSSGYVPSEETPVHDPSESSDNGNEPGDDGNDNNKSNSWMIVAIVFIVAFVIAIVLVVVFIFIKKKRYDRSENEK